MHNAVMRWQLASTFAVAAMSAACYEPATVDCENGYLCPVGKKCAEPGYCGDPGLVEQCFDQAAPPFSGCNYGTADSGSEPGVCLHGVCSPCAANPNLAGCGSAEWQALVSPLINTDFKAIFVFPPRGASPVTHAYVGGVGGVFLEYDGVGFRMGGGPDTLEDINSIWASSETNVYVVTASKLFHFDGTAWRDISSEVPSGVAGALKDVTGAADNDVYIVGIAGAVAHFNGTAWTDMTTGPATWNAALVTSAGFVAVGTAGYILDNGLASQPLPDTHKTINIKDVFSDGDLMTAVGVDIAGNDVSVFERQGSSWVLAPQDGVSDVTFNAGWANFAGGTAGTILVRDAVRWSPVESTPSSSEILAMTGAGREVFAVGRAGAIWRYMRP